MVVETAVIPELLVLGGLAADDRAAQAAVDKALAGGAAGERFAKMVAEMGGPSDFIDHPDRYLARAPVIRPVTAGREGYVTAIDARAYGVIVMGLGGGRSRPEDGIDPAVGLTDIRGPGEPLTRDRPLAVIHARSEADADRAAAELRAVTTIGNVPAMTPVIRERITA